MKEIEIFREHKLSRIQTFKISKGKLSRKQPKFAKVSAFKVLISKHQKLANNSVRSGPLLRLHCSFIAACYEREILIGAPKCKTRMILNLKFLSLYLPVVHPSFTEFESKFQLDEKD